MDIEKAKKAGKLARKIDRLENLLSDLGCIRSVNFGSSIEIMESDGGSQKGIFIECRDIVERAIKGEIAEVKEELNSL